MKAYMLRIEYPDMTNKKAHTAFIAQLDKLRKDYHTSGGNITVIINANQLVINWHKAYL